MKPSPKTVFDQAVVTLGEILSAVIGTQIDRLHDRFDGLLNLSNLRKSES